MLFCQDRAQRDGVSKPPLQMSGSDHVCGAGHCTCITHLSHHPPEEETHRAEMPSGASSSLSGKQGPVPVTQTRYLEPGQFLVSQDRTPAFGALDGDWNLSDRGLKDAKAHSLNKRFCVSNATGQEKKKKEVKYASCE